jgi:putative ABC transport system permease protein
MIRYHLKSAIKFILKFRSHTAWGFIISAWVIQELRLDRFHHQADHIYMVTTDIKDNTGNVNRFPETPAPLASALETNIPQIETGFHFQYLYGGRSIGTNEITFKEEGIAATPAFLKVFNFQLLSGVADELAEPNSIFLSKRLADKMFPGGDPVRKELLYRDSMELIVKGIFKDVPRNSSLQFDFLIPYEIEYGISDEWWQLSDATFIKTRTSADIDKVYTLMKEIWRERITDDQYNIGMIPITDLRYGADFEFFNAEHGHGSRKKLYMFLAVAMMILILACFNYMILISAYAIKRDYEI